jgi:hypothetical protein
MKISVAKNRLKILKMKEKWVNDNKSKSPGPSTSSSKRAEIAVEEDDDEKPAEKKPIVLPAQVDVKQKTQKFEKKIQQISKQAEPPKKK